MDEKPQAPPRNHPHLVAWLRAKEEADAADARLKEARTKLEAIFPPGTPVPDDYPCEWQESQRVAVPDIRKLPAELTQVTGDVKKIRAWAELNGKFPKGVVLEAAYALKVRKAK